MNFLSQGVEDHPSGGGIATLVPESGSVGLSTGAERASGMGDITLSKLEAVEI